VLIDTFGLVSELLEMEAIVAVCVQLKRTTSIFHRLDALPAAQPTASKH